MFLSLLTSRVFVSRFWGFAQIHLSAQLWLTEPSGSRLWCSLPDQKGERCSPMVHCSSNPHCSMLLSCRGGELRYSQGKGRSGGESKGNWFLSDVIPRARNTVTNRACSLSSRTLKLVGKTHTHTDNIIQPALWRRHCRVQQSQCKETEVKRRVERSQDSPCESGMLGRKLRVYRARSPLQDWLGGEAGVRAAGLGSHQGRRSGV